MQQIKWWRQNNRDENRKFAPKVEKTTKDIKEWNQLEALLLDTVKIKDIKEWNQPEALLLDTAKSVLGQTTGKGAYN